VSSQAVAALIGIGGVLAGLVGERLLRVLGRLWCEPSGWELRFVDYNPESPRYGDTDLPPEEASAVEYSVQLDLFNGKEIPVGLRNIEVVLAYEGGELRDRPRDRTTFRVEHGAVASNAVDVINIPPRQFVHKELAGSLGKEGAAVFASGRVRRVEFAGKRPRRPILGILGSKTYRKVVDKGPSERPWWRRVFGG